MNLHNIIHLVEVFKDFQVGDWVWCLHCERCYQVGEYRLDDEFQMCPYPDCDGSTVLDAHPWWGEGVPERGKVYPLPSR